MPRPSPDAAGESVARLHHFDHLLDRGDVDLVARKDLVAEWDALPRDDDRQTDLQDVRAVTRPWPRRRACSPPPAPRGRCVTEERRAGRRAGGWLVGTKGESPHCPVYLLTSGAGLRGRRFAGSSAAAFEICQLARRSCRVPGMRHLVAAAFPGCQPTRLRALR